MTKKSRKFDLSIPRRMYYSNEYSLTFCPECSSELIEEQCPILLCVKSDHDESEFITNLSGSHFCMKCPVVVFDSNKVEQAVQLGIRKDKNIRYAIAGIVDWDAIPDDKKNLEIGSDENPLPLVSFLPERNKQTITTDNKPGRNDPCPCGSGKKYKKCCGKYK